MALGSVAMIEAGRGESEACRAHADESLELAGRLEMQLWATHGHEALGLLELGLDHPVEAARHFVTAGGTEGGSSTGRGFPLANLIEALVRAGQMSRPDEWLRRVVEVERKAQLPLHRAVAARARALLEPGAYQDNLRRALSEHAQSPDRFAEARTRLVFGEFLRRNDHRVDARVQLRAALDTFDALGTTPWSARCRRELRASGESIPRRDPRGTERLTPQELQIALEAAEGKSNRDIAATMFLSSKTVEFHLTRIYRKLDLHSRAELIRLFARRPDLAAAGGLPPVS
jgi:DNA-binding NarL/FixJ family response regulator